MLSSDLQLFVPELYLCLLGLLVLVVDLVSPVRYRSRLTGGLAALGLAAGAVPVLNLWGLPPVTAFQGSYTVDGFATFFKLVFLATGVLVVLLSVGQIREGQSRGEYLSLLVFLVLGLCLMASASDLVLIYLSFELVSLSSYLLAAWAKTDRQSNEAGVKYFIYGAAASAVMLYGLTLLYGAGGSTNLTVLAERLIQPRPGAGAALVVALGTMLMAVGMGYKISMAPFHAWAPDVYQGAPTPVTALLSVGPKAAGFALVMRVFLTLSPTLHIPWQMVLAILAALTMFTGNLLAIRQTDVKRMLAYSSIAHAGYLLIGVVVAPGDVWGVSGILVYVVAYLLMNLGLFGVAILLERDGGSASLEHFAGLARIAPGLAAMTVVFLLSLTGIPPTAGFLGKLYLFAAAIKSRQWAWLAVVGIVNSVISLYYYMNLARLMYFADAPRPRLRSVPASVLCVVLVAAVGTVGVFVFPQWLLEAARFTAAVR